MTLKKYIAAGLSMLLCACGTESETVETDIIETNMPESGYISEAADTVGTEDEKEAEDTELVIDMDSFADNEDMPEMPDVKVLRVNNTGTKDLSFIGRFTSLENLVLNDCEGVENIKLLKGAVNAAHIAVYDKNYSSENGSEFFSAFPAADAEYFEAVQNKDRTEAELDFYAYPLILADTENNAQLYLKNDTDRTGYAFLSDIMYPEGSGWASYGIKEIELGEVSSGSQGEFQIPSSEIFPDDAPKGRCKLVCTFRTEGEDTESEAEIFITDPFIDPIPEEIFCPQRPDTRYYYYKTPDFLTTAQLEAFKKAYITEAAYFGTDMVLSENYASTHTADEFISELTSGFTYEYALERAQGIYIDENGEFEATSRSSGVDISLAAVNFAPIYYNENEVLFKAEKICWYDDEFYNVSYAQRNFHMVKTDEGWKFDCFGMWY
ncbi:hypothetical protein [Huintestinicola sp.]